MRTSRIFPLWHHIGTPNRSVLEHFIDKACSTYEKLPTLPYMQSQLSLEVCFQILSRQVQVQKSLKNPSQASSPTHSLASWVWLTVGSHQHGTGFIHCTSAQTTAASSMSSCWASNSILRPPVSLWLPQPPTDTAPVVSGVTCLSVTHFSSHHWTHLHPPKSPIFPMAFLLS